MEHGRVLPAHRYILLGFIQMHGVMVPSNSLTLSTTLYSVKQYHAKANIQYNFISPMVSLTHEFQQLLWVKRYSLSGDFTDRNDSGTYKHYKEAEIHLDRPLGVRQTLKKRQN